MGTVASDVHFGGSYYRPITGNRSQGWDRLRRVVVIVPDAGGYTVTLKAASSAEIPYGMLVWAILNGSGSNAFTLADTEGEFSESIAAGKWAFISKYDNSGGAARFAIDKRDGL